MWEYLGHSKSPKEGPSTDGLSRMPSITLNPEQGLANVAEETVVPNNHPFLESAVVSASPANSHIYFKDLKLLARVNDNESDEEDEGIHSRSGEKPPIHYYDTLLKKKRVDRQKLVIIVVGLPARGKTFLCNKIMCYFNWLGHPTKHFNIGKYRRSHALPGEVHDSRFFDPKNPAGAAARQKALECALADMEEWLASDSAQVAILDATNSTKTRRKFLRDHLHGRFEYMFLESVCTDPIVLEQNYRLKMLHSPDYAGMDMDQALRDFRDRIQRYEAEYETIVDRTLHYVKLIDMLTGRGHMDVNRISGYIPGKMVFFLMQICKALGRPRRIWLTRHGESEFNVLGKIGGNSALSPRGIAYGQLLPVVLSSRLPKDSQGRDVPVAVWTSTLERTILTAALLEYPRVQWKALDEIQAGICDGMTYDEIASQLPTQHEARQHDKLHYRYPSGESYMDVIQRLEPVVIEVERERECVCIVAHQAVLRALYGYFMNRPLSEVPCIDIPLHTLIELNPKADGTMAETRFHVDVDKAMRETGWVDVDDVSSLDSGSFHRRRQSQEDGGGSGTEESLGIRKSVSLAELAAAELVVRKEMLDDQDE